MNLIKTALDENGNLIRAKDLVIKQLKVITLLDDPFEWVETVKKDTNNYDKAFIKKFFKDLKLDFDSMSDQADWLPYYYTAYIMELSNVIRELGIKKFKDSLLDKEMTIGNVNFIFSKKILDTIPDNLNEKTTVEKISDIFNGFINVQYLMFMVG